MKGKRKWTTNFFFVCYCRRDEDVVQKVLKPLREAGFAFWIDKRNLPVGGHWAGDIVAAIRACHAVLMFCSKEAFASNDVYRQVAMAGRCNKFILPVFLDGARAPDDFLYYLTIHNAVHADAPDWLGQVCRALSDAQRRARH